MCFPTLYHFLMITMAESHDSLHLQCKLSYIRLTNLGNVGLTKNLFMRCYISAGSGRRIQIDTREIPSRDDLTWDCIASVECQGPSSRMQELREQHSIVFELRRRKEMPVLGRLARSELFGRAEIAWRDVWGSTDMSVERQVSLGPTKCLPVAVEPPVLVVRVEVGVSKAAENGRVGRRVEWKEGCSCGDCEWRSVGEDEVGVFAVADDACE
ncbi:uncharacterized protein LOC120111775 [Phoenix dactylifera]|uniref:Uncharacterized protein LOC120111775 n=1 Tax=Phoenix dactylifera TaxID=42345 RepID=A0A8B9AIJ5_PHODC|nr:uncharacterized protein LOC120111775 [Phoenix dactylifera]